MMDINTLSKHPIKNITANQLDYYYIEKGEGETIFLLHGFPDLASTWDEAIDKLSENYRCIAPFLRGYFPTAIPTDGDYRQKSVATDIHEIAKQLGIEKYYVIGHDWGASVAYSMFNLYPKHIKRGITVAIPHPSVIKPNLLLFWKARHFFTFSNEKRSVTVAKKNDFKYIENLYRRWSPNWKDYKATSELVKATFRLENRLEAALGYYWTFNKTRTDKALNKFYNQIPTMPVMTFAGKTDGASIFKPFQQMQKTMNSDFRLVVHEDAGHFLHNEDVDFFVEHVLEFIQK